MKELTSHELAQKLLAMPNKQVDINFNGYSIPACSIAEFEDNVAIFADPRRDYGIRVVQSKHLRIYIDVSDEILNKIPNNNTPQGERGSRSTECLCNLKGE